MCRRRVPSHTRDYQKKQGKHNSFYLGYSTILNAYGAFQCADGAWLASGSQDASIKLWNVKTGALHKTLAGGNAWIFCLHFSSNNQLLASGAGYPWGRGSDHLLKIWDINTGTVKYSLDTNAQYISHVQFSSDSQSLVWVSGNSNRDNSIANEWNFSGTKTTYSNINRPLSYAKNTYTEPYSIESPDQKIIVVVNDNTITVKNIANINVSTNRCIVSMSSSVGALSIYQRLNEIFLASGHGDCSVRCWKIMINTETPYLQLIWATHQNTLQSQDICLERVNGLSQNNLDLLLQRGTIPLMLSNTAKVASGTSNATSSSVFHSNNNDSYDVDVEVDLDKEKKKCVMM